jgi:hypothetical protein
LSIDNKRNNLKRKLKIQKDKRTTATHSYYLSLIFKGAKLLLVEEETLYPQSTYKDFGKI